MDEMANEAVVAEETEPIEETAEAEEVSDAEFDELWDDDGGDYGFESDSEEADQQTEEQTEEATGQATSEQPEAEGADQYLELKHFDEVRKVNKEEAKVLAQKGMDYDRIRERADKLQKYEEFLNEIKGDFSSIEDLMDDTRARLKMDKDGITYDAALEKVKSANQPKGQAERESVLEQMRRESVEAFAQKHPEMKPEDVPKEVWDDVFVTNNLEASYAKYEAKKLKEENETLKKNAKNKSRSTGSMRSSGNSSYEKSEFDRVMEEDDW